MSISNKTLVFLLVIAIVVTIFGTWYSIDSINKFASITGFQTSGNVTVNITERVEINVTQPNCAFGSGYVTPPAAYAILHPGNESPYCATGENPFADTKTNWANTTAYNPGCIVVRNDGNRWAKVNVSSGKNPNTFIGGTNPNVTVWSENKETDSCATGAEVNLVPFPGVEMDTSNRTVCSCLYPDDSKDELYIGCRLKVPDDTTGYKSDTWTFTATLSQNVPDCGGE
ncbi:MAG: hypothetical protein ACPLXC_03370 [Candidatus Pacearchaeota archaeon]